MTLRNLEKYTKEIVGWLDENQVDYAIVGGIAVSFRTIERTTRDVDFAISVESDSRSERIVRDLGQLGYKVEAVLEQSKQGRLATVRFIKQVESEIFIDFLFASSGIEDEVAARSQSIEIFPGLNAKIADLASLLALKTLSANETDRLQDILDIRALLKEATSEDLAEAILLLKLITDRGFNRNKNLETEFGAFVARFK